MGLGTGESGRARWNKKATGVTLSRAKRGRERTNGEESQRAVKSALTFASRLSIREWTTDQFVHQQ